MSRILFGLAVAGVLWAGVAPAQETEDPLAKAILVLKQTAAPESARVRNFAFKLDRARKLLVEQADKSLPMVVALLDENVVQIRLNAAIVLAQMAMKGGKSSDLIGALKRCVNDSNAGVAYWGMVGILGSDAPPKDKAAAAAACLNTDRPRPLRVATALIAKENKVREAVPYLIEHLKNILVAYRDQRDNALTYKTTGGGRMPAGPLRGAPGERYAPSGPGARGSYGPGRVPELGARPTPGTYGRERPTGARRTLRPGARLRPGMPAGAAAEEYEKPAPPPKINPDKLSYTEIQQLIPTLLEVPSIMEVQQIGLALEALVSKRPRESPFGFAETPPWALDKCIEKAAAWLDEHKAEFPYAPKPASAPEKKPAAG